MQKKHLAKLAGVGAAAAALTLTATTAAHALTPTVVVGSFTTAGSHAFTATSTSAGIGFTAQGPGGTSAAMTCASVGLGGSITSGAYTPGTTTIATIATGGTWSGCQGVGLHLAVSQLSVWNLKANTPGSPTTGSITNIQAEVQDTDLGGALCVFDVAGSVTGSYSNTSHQLTVSASSLTVDVDPHSTGAGCSGLILDGGSATFTGVFNVASPDGAVSIQNL